MDLSIQSPQTTTPPAGGRIVSLDAFRGLAIILMFLASKKSPFAQLRHAPWDGGTVGDLVYPFFLFAAGISLALTFDRVRGNAEAEHLYQRRFLRRCALLFFLGVLLTSISRREFCITLGTLQCIALCLLFTFPCVRISRQKLLWAYAGFLLIAYLLSAIVRPAGAPWELRWQQGHTLAEAVDVMLFGQPRGEEGVLTTLFSTAAVVLGLYVARSKTALGITAPYRWFAFAVSFIAAALVLSLAIPSQSLLFVPIIPNLVSPSFSLLAAGAAMLLLGLLHFFAANAKLVRLLRPLVICGRNALAAYVAVKLFQELALDFAVFANGTEAVTVGMIVRDTIGKLLGETAGRLSIPLTKISVALLLCTYLDRKRLYIRL